MSCSYIIFCLCVKSNCICCCTVVTDRKNDVEGKSIIDRVENDGGRNIKKNNIPQLLTLLKEIME